MTPDPALSAALVGAGGAVGAVLRWAVTDRVEGPAGTAAVNVVGSFVLALVTFLGAGDRVALLVGTGACGAFTTFSSFAVDVVDLQASGESRLAAFDAVGTLAAALAGVGLAWLLASAL